MPSWVRGFIIPDVAQVHAEFQKCIRDAEVLALEERRLGKDMGARALLVRLRGTYAQFNNNLRLAAVKGSEEARKGMVDHLKATRLRPEVGGGGLERALAAAPLSLGNTQTGAVGVGDTELLDHVVSRHAKGYGTYWRAQEYGTGQNGVPSQLGRILMGSFMEAGGGGATPPDPQYAGGGGPHPIFLSRSRGAPSEASGFGTIGKEIEGKHFIRDGAEEAAAKWRQRIAAAQAKALEDLSGIGLGGA